MFLGEVTVWGSGKICPLPWLGRADNSLFLSSYPSRPLAPRTPHLPLRVYVWHRGTLPPGIIRWHSVWECLQASVTQRVGILLHYSREFPSTCLAPHRVMTGVPLNSVFSWTTDVFSPLLLHSVTRVASFRCGLTRKSGLQLKMHLPQPPRSWKHMRGYKHSQQGVVYIVP